MIARRGATVLLAAVLLASCAIASPPRARVDAPEPPPRRCAPGDPHGTAWYCVVGRVLYGVLASIQPINELTMR